MYIQIILMSYYVSVLFFYCFFYVFRHKRYFILKIILFDNNSKGIVITGIIWYEPAIIYMEEKSYYSSNIYLFIITLHNI